MFVALLTNQRDPSSLYAVAAVVCCFVLVLLKDALCALCISSLLSPVSLSLSLSPLDDDDDDDHVSVTLSLISISYL